MTVNFSRLRGTRLGAVFSVLWIAGSLLFAHARLENEHNQVRSVLLDQCQQGKVASPTNTSCSAHATAIADRIVVWNRDRVLALALLAIGPLALAGTGGWLLVAIRRRVRTWRASAPFHHAEL